MMTVRVIMSWWRLYILPISNSEHVNVLPVQNAVIDLEKSWDLVMIYKVLLWVLFHGLSVIAGIISSCGCVIFLLVCILLYPILFGGKALHAASNSGPSQQTPACPTRPGLTSRLPFALTLHQSPPQGHLLPPPPHTLAQTHETARPSGPQPDCNPTMLLSGENDDTGSD